MPPLVMGGVALALMVAVLPSSLHLPVTGPGSQAEVAPVPGQGNSQSNLSALGLADGGTVGSGGAGLVADAFGPTPSPLGALLGALPGRSMATNVHCVGNPPRQTEDPLSPPCVASWSGDNGGATSPGVTGKAVIVVAQSQFYGHDGVNFTDAPAATDEPYERTLKVLLRFFQTRFQTYGRQVVVINKRPPSDADAIQRYHPFAFIRPNSGTPSNAAGLKVVSFEGVDRRGWGCGLSQAQIAAAAPYAWCFNPTRDAMQAALVNYACSGLVGKPAAASPDAGMRTRTRRWGILVYTDESDVAARGLQTDLASRCGATSQLYKETSTDPSKPDLLNLAIRMQQDGVTSVLRPEERLMGAASHVGYLPEWVFAGGRLTTSYEMRPPAGTGDPPASEAAGAFGIIDHWRMRPRTQTYAGMAYSSIDPAGTMDSWYWASEYYSLLALFTAIQRAGSNLNPQSLQSGLESFTASTDLPFSPRAGYSGADHTFVDDFMIARWDNTGSPPDGAAGSGCLRLVDGGARYRAEGPWPQEDRASQAGAADPCQAEEMTATDFAADSR